MRSPCERLRALRIVVVFSGCLQPALPRLVVAGMTQDERHVVPHSLQPCCTCRKDLAHGTRRESSTTPHAHLMAGDRRVSDRPYCPVYRPVSIYRESFVGARRSLALRLEGCSEMNDICDPPHARKNTYQGYYLFLLLYQYRSAHLRVMACVAIAPTLKRIECVRAHVLEELSSQITSRR